MGPLGWAPADALTSDALTIRLAYEGWQDQRETLEHTIYASQGIKLPPPEPRWRKEQGKRASWDDTWRSFTKEHNARWRASERARRRAGAKTARPSKLPAS